MTIANIMKTINLSLKNQFLTMRESENRTLMNMLIVPTYVVFFKLMYHSCLKPCVDSIYHCPHQNIMEKTDPSARAGKRVN